MSTPAQQELRDLIASKLDNALTPEENANVLMSLFYRVEDDWDAIDVSTMLDGPGGKLLDQRWLVARIPREARHRDMVPDRTVTP